MDRAPRPSNFRSLLTYLKDHPEGFRKALNLIPRRLLSLYLVAYQSYLWNRIAGGYLASWLAEERAEGPDPVRVSTLTMLNLKLPIYHALSASQHAALRGIALYLPGHRAVYADPALSDIVREVLTDEGFVLNDLKARILKRAYLPKGKRPLLLHPSKVDYDNPVEDQLFPGRQAMTLQFTLPSGAFASLIVKRLQLVD